MVDLPTSLPSSKDGERERKVVEQDGEAETYEVTSRVSRTMSQILQRSRVPMAHTSVKSVAEELVEENSFEISNLVRGVKDYINFARELEHMLGVDRDFTKFYHQQSQYRLGNLDHSIFMELRMYESGGLKSVEIEADMNKSDVIRASLIKGIYDHIDEGDVELTDSEEREIIETWYEIRNSFAYYHRRFESLLFVNLVDNKDYIEMTFEKYPGSAMEFSRYYKNSFLGSDGHDRMEKMEVVEPFVNLEELINEYTSMEVNYYTGAEYWKN